MTVETPATPHLAVVAKGVGGNDAPPMSDRLAVTVVTPVYDDVVNLKACLDKLLACDPPPARVIVVDDASPPAAAEAIRRLCEENSVFYLKMEQNVGPAVARNRGADAAETPIVFFIDADCEAAPDAIGRIELTLDPDSPYDAVFGSYDDAPSDRHLVSAWKNLAHHHTHQQGNPEARTFWSGCGAVKREIFQKMGGFDESYGRPCIEDIELGMRMTDAGHRVRLDRALQVKHRKRWTLWKLLKTDLFDRAIPWTRAMRRRPTTGGGEDLNLKASQKLSALLTLVTGGLLLIAVLLDWRAIAVPILWLAMTLIADWKRALEWPAALVAIATLVVACFGDRFVWIPLIGGTLAVIGVVLLNRGLYVLVAKRLGVAAAMLSIVPHGLHFAVAILGFAIGKLSPVDPGPQVAARTA